MLRKNKKLRREIDELQAEVHSLKEERIKWLEYKQEKDRIRRKAWRKKHLGKEMKMPPFPTTCLQQLTTIPTQSE